MKSFRKKARSLGYIKLALYRLELRCNGLDLWDGHCSSRQRNSQGLANLTCTTDKTDVRFVKYSHYTDFFKRLGLFLSQQELTSRSSHRFSNVPAIPTCHSWAQGRGKKGRRHSGAGGMVAAGERCSWPRPVLSFPQKAVGGWWIVLALLGHSRLR